MLISDRIKDKVVEILTAEILNENIKGGTELKQEELAEKLQISRIPIREALMTLQEYGLVERKSNRHTYVIKIDNDYLKKIYEMIILMVNKILKDIMMSVYKKEFLEEINLLNKSVIKKEEIFMFHKIIEKNIHNMCIENIFLKLNNTFFKYGASLSDEEILSKKLKDILIDLKEENLSKLDIDLSDYYQFILKEILEKRRKING